MGGTNVGDDRHRPHLSGHRDAAAGRLEDEDLLFIAWMRHAMAGRRLTQRQVAMLARVDHSTISRLLRGERTGLRYMTALRLYQALENETTTPLLERSFSRDADAVRAGQSGAVVDPVARRRLD
jgi:hypothetical protein